MTRRQYAGGAKQTTITGSVASSGAVSIAIADATGWPDVSTGPFAAVIDPGTPSEEKVLVTNRVGLTLTVTSPNRGYDGTSAIGHSSGATIYHTYTATDFDEANAHINASAAAHTASAITNVPAGNIAATSVQAAINELDNEKAAVGHTQASSTITDFAEAVQDVVGAMIVDGTGIDSTYSDGGNTLTIAVDPTEFPANESVQLARSAAQSVSNGTPTKISWDTETVATSWIAVTADTLTVPAGMDGWYVISAQTITESGTLAAQLMVAHAGNSYLLHGPLDRSNLQAGGQGTVLLRLAAADTLQFWYFHLSGSTKTVQGNLRMVRVSM